jgi:hypothetical protein
MRDRDAGVAQSLAHLRDRLAVLDAERPVRVAHGMHRLVRDAGRGDEPLISFPQGIRGERLAIGLREGVPTVSVGFLGGPGRQALLQLMGAMPSQDADNPLRAI